MMERNSSILKTYHNMMVKFLNWAVNGNDVCVTLDIPIRSCHFPLSLPLHQRFLAFQQKALVLIFGYGSYKATKMSDL